MHFPWQRASIGSRPRDLYEAQLRRSIRLQICCIKFSEGNPTVGDVTTERPLQQYSSLLALYGSMFV